MKSIIVLVFVAFIVIFNSCTNPIDCVTTYSISESETLSLRFGDEYSTYYDYVITADTFGINRNILRDTLITIDSLPNNVVLRDTTITLDTIVSGSFLNFNISRIDTINTSKEISRDFSIVLGEELEFGNSKLDENYSRIILQFIEIDEENNLAKLLISKYNFYKDCSGW